MKARISIDYNMNEDKTLIQCSIPLKGNGYFMAMEEYKKHPSEFLPEHAKTIFKKLKHNVESQVQNQDDILVPEITGYYPYEWIVDL